MWQDPTDTDACIEYFHVLGLKMLLCPEATSGVYEIEDDLQVKEKKNPSMIFIHCVFSEGIKRWTLD